MAYKQEAAVRQEKDALTKSCAKTAADDLWAELCNPPIDEYGDLSNDGYERWVDNVNRVIKERIDFHSILEIMRKAEEIGISRQAAAKAVKRHSENHAIRDEIYAWLDANLGAWNSLNDAAAKMAMKVVPLKYEAVRRHCTEWNRLRKETPV